MKYLINLLIVLASGMLAAQTEQRVFSSSKDFVDYAYANTNLESFKTGYLLNLDYTVFDKEFDLNAYVSELKDPAKVNGDKLTQMLHIMEKSDVHQSFIKTDITNPIYDDFYKVTPTSFMDIPLLIFDMDVELLKKNAFKNLKEWNDDAPFPTVYTDDAYTENIQLAGPFIKNVINPNVRFYWTNDLFFTNKNKEIESVTLKINGQSISLQENEFIQLFDYVDQEIHNLNVLVTYRDASSFSNEFSLDILKEKPFGAKSEGVQFDAEGTIDATWESSQLDYKILYACGRNKILKPFIVIAGWGPYTDNEFFNNLEVGKSKWPTSIDDLYQDFNNYGLIDAVREQGYDVIICKFFPPNTYVQHNANAIIKAIKMVNNQKFANGSYEENIIFSYSAGAVGTRLALLKMEFEHLNQGGQHPHTKIYFSFDGEHQGANIPLGAQHMVKHMYNNSIWPNWGMHIDGLNYILDAPLTQQILYYSYQGTGDVANGGSAGQGCSPMRPQFLNYQNLFNHSENGHNPGYPAFTRNISIAQGANTGVYNGGSNQQNPFPYTEGIVLMDHTSANKKQRGEFLNSGGNTVFEYEKSINYSWTIQNTFQTSSECLVLDNAPGGTMTVIDNPVDAIVKVMSWAFIGVSTEKKKHTQYCFTPTIFCHDIRNFDPSVTGYRLKYNMGENHLLHDSPTSYLLGSSTDFYGYPHLASANNHYSTLTPFDAVYSSSINEEHILCNRIYRYDLNDYDEPFINLYNNFVNPQLDFILGEADYQNAYIQNEEYGRFCASNYIFRSKIQAPQSVYIGKNVTNRTDFKPAIFRANSHIDVRAGKEIRIAPGTNVYAGSRSHFKITDFDCAEVKSMVTSNEGTNEATENASETGFNTEEVTDWVSVYPNPSSGKVFVQFKDDPEANMEFAIYAISGQLIQQDKIFTNRQELELPKGIYIIKIYNHEKSSTQRLIVL